MKVLRFLLFPFSILYDFVTRIRNIFFDIGVFKQTLFKIPVIIVGNLSVGGTGKTPQIEYLIRLLKDSYKTAVLSRGYKRETVGFVLLNKNHAAADVGDEPLQYFKKFKNINVAVDANRVEGITNLISEVKPDVVLLDDAFQHRKVKGSFYVLLTKYDDLFVDDFLLPTGNLRESRQGAKRAEVILVTKCPENLSKDKQDTIKLKLSKFNKKVFFTSISYADKVLGSVEIPTLALKNFEVLLITGIANPTPLLNYLEGLSVKFQHLKYADHHHFSDVEVKDIQKKFDEIQSSKIILTTEKDYVRLVNHLENLSYLPIETSFLNNEDEVFNTLINNHIKGSF
ncbi:tetraacyldisaccharide 4'-kinase [Polaribacter sp. ALD11]|uniref:tetraacyldisaccharide 4'-kinase n=1 Tax=Polaribacter sp. ALD11 TaxID=2058137 RepID=UPI000C3065CE|nr:tetraacyldisaccharide 4'-kinase [Polaribacter sp. ALD11]AUC85154.1 tetraacyldisaccharide 4'-kinase [Polaribacter sp. ALD11]